MMKRILFVEDSDLIALSESGMLLKSGYHVTRVRSCEEALKLVAGGKCFDLVLMDLEPEAGINVVEAMSGILECGRIPVMFVASHERFEPGVMARKIRYACCLFDKTEDNTVLDNVNRTIELFNEDFTEGDLDIY